MRWKVSRRSTDSGSATVVSAAVITAVLAAAVLGLHLGSAVATRHRAEGAADLGALAVAAHAVEGQQAACGRAHRIARRMHVAVVSCRLWHWDSFVEVRAPLGIPTGRYAVARARAGPDALSGGSRARAEGTVADQWERRNRTADEQ